MSASLNREQGFSLPEVLLSVVLMIMVVTALTGGISHIANGNAQLAQYRQLWREAWRQTQRQSTPPGENWQANRVQTSYQRCVSISVTITTPLGRQGKMSRLHCPHR